MRSIEEKGTLMMARRLARTGTLTAALVGASVLLPLTASSEEPPAICGT